MKKISLLGLAAAIIAAPLFLATPANAGGYDPEVDCESAGFGTARSLTNGDHINMDIVQDGKKFQLNAYVDRNIQGGHDTLGVRINTPSGQKSIPLTEAQVKAGALVFDYAQYLPSTKPHTVEWVQFNSSYFNQDRNPGKFLNCGEEEPPVVPEKPQPIVDVKRGETVNCESREVTLTETTTTTDWKLVDNVWVKAEPVVTVKETKRPATEIECELPHVGFANAMPLLGGGLALTALGAGAIIYNKRRQNA